MANSVPDATLSDADKTAIQETNGLAQQQLEQTQNRTQRIAEYIEVASRSETTIVELKAQIESIDLTAPAAPTQLPADTLRSEIDLLVAERTSSSAALETLREQQNALAVRGPSIATEISSIRENSAALENISGDGPNGSLAFALRSLALTRLLNSRLAVTDLQLELTSIPARQAVIEQRVLLAELRVAQLAARIGVLTESLNRTRVGRAQSAVAASEDALQRLETASLPIQSIANENMRLAQNLHDMAQEQYEIDLETALLREQIAEIEQSRQIVERVLATGRLTDELGILLRNVRARQLPIAPLQQRVRRNEESRIAQELNPIIWQERLQRLADANVSQRLIAEASPIGESLTPASEEQIAAVSPLIEQRKILLADLMDSAKISRERLVDHAIMLASIINQTDELTDLLDRRLLWLRNQDPIARDWLTNLPASAAWLLNPRAWHLAAMDLIRQILQNPLTAFLGLSLPLLLWANRRRFAQINENLAANVGHVGNDTVWSTPLALLMLCLLALPWPFFIAVVGGILSLGEDLSSFGITLVPSLAALASLIFLLTLFRKLSQEQGIFQSHFQWSEASLKKLHTNLIWFTWVQCIATFIFSMAVNSVEPAIHYSLGLLSFVTLSVAMSVIAYVFMNPMNGVFVSISMETEASFWQKLVFPLLVATPLVIGVTPLFGYFDTAVLLQSLAFQSGLLLLFVAVFHGVSLRMLQVVHRRFSLRQIRQIRAHVLTERATSSKSVPKSDSDDSTSKVNNPPEQVGEMSQQLKHTIFSVALLILGFGIWFIWRPLLPTVGISDDIVLWQGTRVIDGVAMSQGITLWDLFVALFFFFGGLYLARNIRQLLELGLFERLTLDAGGGYAAVSIAGYVVVAVTSLIGIAQLGIDWSKMQWIVAALGVGLGFGLQEIVANFVSGLIILFERPVQVGDTVTIGELTGTVSKISIRATTILDFDNREVLLPNKAIITDNVVNWTLNNPVTRVVVKIGVAYGSDLKKVCEILQAVAAKNKDVLETPASQVFLMEHGESSINYEMRVFVSSPSMRWPVAHDLNISINTLFAESDIVIPFPQRDVHVFDHSKPLS